MPIAALGIDLGKNNCSVAGLDETGTLSCAEAAAAERRQVERPWANLGHVARYPTRV
jgi:molecular chaperone DnaK (HSP70)